MLKHTPIWIRTVAATLLFAMVYYFAGYRLIYFMITADARYEASLAMKNKETVLEKITFPQSEYNKLKWAEGNKEFVSNGQLYDVVSITKSNNEYVAEVYCDKNETQWVKALHNFVKQLFPSNNKSDKHTESIITAFQKEYIPLNVVHTATPDVTYVKQYLHTVNSSSRYPDKGIWHPPSGC